MFRGEKTSRGFPRGLFLAFFAAAARSAAGRPCEHFQIRRPEAGLDRDDVMVSRNPGAHFRHLPVAPLQRLKTFARIVVCRFPVEAAGSEVVKDLSLACNIADPPSART